MVRVLPSSMCPEAACLQLILVVCSSVCGAARRRAADRPRGCVCACVRVRRCFLSESLNGTITVGLARCVILPLILTLIKSNSTRVTVTMISVTIGSAFLSSPRVASWMCARSAEAMASLRAAHTRPWPMSCRPTLGSPNGGPFARRRASSTRTQSRGIPPSLAR